MTQEPLSEEQIIAFTQLKRRDIRDLLRELQQFVEIIGDRSPLYLLYHTSFAEYLLDSKQNRDYWIDGQKTHQRIANRYLRAWGGFKANLRALQKTEKRDLDDGYGLRHIAAHLEGAGHTNNVHRLLALKTSEQRNVWYNAKESIGDSEGYLYDIMRAWQLAEKEYRLKDKHTKVGRYIGLQIRYALIISSLNSISADIPPSLLPALVEQGVWSPIQALSCARLKPRSFEKANALFKLAPHLPEPFLESAFQIAQAIHGEEERGAALVGLIPRLAELGHAQEALQKTREIDYQFHRAAALVGLVRYLPSTLLPEALQIAKELEFAGDRAKALTAIVSAPRLDDPLKTEILKEALKSVRAIAPRSYGYDLVIMESLILLAPHLSYILRQEALDIAQTMQDSRKQANALSEITLYIAKLGDLEKALKILKENRNQLFKVEALKKLAPFLSKKSLMPQALQMVREFQPIYQSENDKVEALAGIAPHIPEPLHWEALQIAKAIQYTGIQFWIFDKLATCLPKLGYPEEALKLVKSISYERHRTAALVALTQSLPQPLLPKALKIAQKLKHDGDRAKALTVIATKLSDPFKNSVLVDALSAAWKIREGDFVQEPHEYACAEALADLVPLLSESLLKKTISKLMQIVRKKYELYGMPDNYEPTATATSTIKIVVPRLAECSPDISYPAWCEILHFMARRTRADLLRDLSAMKDVILTFGGEDAALETVCAIQDVGEWWA